MSADGIRGQVAAAIATIDRRFVGVSVAWAALSLIAFGILNAIIPTPFFERPIAPEPFAIAVWLVSAPLMGVIAATYTAPARTVTATAAAAVPLSELETPRSGTTLGTVAGFGTFLAIGCPVCNKIALVLLGTSGALSIYAPIQPFIGAVSLGLLAATVAWRLRIRARAEACAVAPASPRAR